MKKFLSIALSILIIIPSSVALAADGYIPKGDIITQEEAQQFADELKELNSEETYDSSLRLIITSSRQIDYLDAVDTATGIDDLYVLQFDNEVSVRKAEKYYKSLPYVKYVEYDFGTESILCATEDDFDFVANCVSTVNSNIDDAIKLMHKEDIEMSEIRIGVIDSGIAITSFTENRIDGGSSFIDGYSEDGTDDRVGHGTQVAGTIIQNSLDNVRLYSYQIIDGNGSGSLVNAASAIYLAITDGCKILNCSFSNENAGMVPQFLVNAIDTATKEGIFVVCSAGNDSKDLESFSIYPASIENAITVGATGQNKTLASFSNFGKGVDIYATGRGMTSYTNTGKEETNWKGTSAAAPVISSVCALLVLTKPDITVDEAKELLSRTGESTNESNQNDEHRVIANAYECIKQLTGSELERVQFDYQINGKEISFNCEDENAVMYYCNNLGGTLEIPYRHDPIYSFYKYNNGETVTLSKSHILIVCAYAPGKAKSKIEYLQMPIFDYESGYLVKEANATQEYNIVSRCQEINEEVIEVPQYIDDVEVQEIGNYCFMGNPTVETIILPESVKQIDDFVFANCHNLKTVIAPGVEFCGRYAFYQCENLINVEMPNVTAANTGLFKNCTSLETAKLGTLTEIDNHAFYGCENLKLVKTTDDDISFCKRTFYNCNNLTIYTPQESAMETFALSNDIALLGDVIAKGGSIRITDAGLRFGFQYNEKQELNHIDEYGFIYSNDAANKNLLTVENVGNNNIYKKTADNRIDHGDYITYNLVFIKLPATAYDQMVYTRAYVCVGGEYFYSDVIEHSFSSVAEKVLADSGIDEQTKNQLIKILEK